MASNPRWTVSKRRYNTNQSPGPREGTKGRVSFYCGPLSCFCGSTPIFDCDSESCQCLRSQILFVSSAFVQMFVVVTLQVLIITQFGGDGRRLPEYQHCLSTDLQMAINCSVKANWTNVTIPSFGKDMQIYAGFIVSLTIYNAIICLYALYYKHLYEMYSFVVVQCVLILYASLEARELLPFGQHCWTIAGILSLLTVGFLITFGFGFAFLAQCMWRNFRWKVYIDVNCDRHLRIYYQWYEVLSSSIKVLILFTIVFCVAQVTLLLPTYNYEFELTIILIAMAFVVYFVAQLTIYYNSCCGHIILSFTGICLTAYYVFKVSRFFAKDCPTCKELLKALFAEYRDLEILLGNCANISNAKLNEEGELLKQFLMLSTFGIVNLAITIAVLAIHFCFCCFLPGKDISDHFKKRPPWIVHRMCCYCEKSLWNEMCCCYCEISRCENCARCDSQWKRFKYCCCKTPDCEKHEPQCACDKSCWKRFPCEFKRNPGKWWKSLKPPKGIESLSSTTEK